MLQNVVECFGHLYYCMVAGGQDFEHIFSKKDSGQILNFNIPSTEDQLNILIILQNVSGDILISDLFANSMI